MKYTKEQKQKAYKSLPIDIQDFIMSNETTDITEELLTVAVNEPFVSLSDSEILYAMYGLQTLDSAIENISKISGKSVAELQTLKTNLWNEIFSKIEEMISASKKLDPVTAKKRVGDIVNKYGLSSSQATVLENEVMSVIDRNLGENITSSDLVNLLNISNILADQIVYELENRVFERGLTKPTSTPKVVEPPQEIASVAKNEPVSFGGTTLNIPKEMIKPAFQNSALDSQKGDTGTSIGVPRYATEEIYKTPAPSSNPIVGNKLNSVTPSIKPIETKYQKDPYREPLE